VRDPSAICGSSYAGRSCFSRPHLHHCSSSRCPNTEVAILARVRDNAVDDEAFRCAGEVYAVKDTAEVTCIKKAAFLAANAFTKFTVPQIESAPALMVISMNFIGGYLTLGDKLVTRGMHILSLVADH